MKHGENRRSVSSKAFVAMLALVLALGCAVGGTIAWLTAQTPDVKNTFTYGNINIELYEHVYDAATNELTEQTTNEVNNYKIVPGKNLPKDPTVKVVGGSEACYLFVKVEEENWPDFKDGSSRKVSYAIANGWTELETGVYYREVANSDANQVFQVLANDEVTVSNTLTKGEIETVKNTTPKLTFTAYAVQKENVKDAAAAWDLVKPATPVAP